MTHRTFDIALSGVLDALREFAESNVSVFFSKSHVSFVSAGSVCVLFDYLLPSDVYIWGKGAGAVCRSFDRVAPVLQ